MGHSDIGIREVRDSWTLCRGVARLAYLAAGGYPLSLAQKKLSNDQAETGAVKLRKQWAVALCWIVRASSHCLVDVGGVILIGNYQTQAPADRVRFSLDQGGCWHNILFSEAIDIVNIR